MDKILISRGFGAGWTTWNSDMAKTIGRSELVIKFLESGGKFEPSGRKHTKDGWETPWEDYKEPGRSILKLLCEECKEKHGSYPYLGGARDLVVEYAEPDSEVYEYDGNESLTPFGGGTRV